MKKLNKFSYYINLLLFLVILSLFLTIFNLMITINPTIQKLIALISLIIYLLINNILEGKKKLRKAYISGLKKGGCTVLLLYILSLITLNFKLNINRIIYYLIILITCILGQIIGINKKDLNN